MMRRLIAVGIALSLCVLALPALASGIDSSATVVGTPDGSAFNYSLTLNNSATSTDSIGTLWFAWVPGAGCCPTSPTRHRRAPVDGQQRHERRAKGWIRDSICGELGRVRPRAAASR